MSAGNSESSESMSRREELIINFNKVGITVPSKVLDSCVEICERQKISEAAFVDSWLAFSVTVLNASIPPTIDKLTFFEKREFGDPMLSTPTPNKSTNILAKKDMPSPSTPKVIRTPQMKRKSDQLESGFNIPKSPTHPFIFRRSSPEPGATSLSKYRDSRSIDSDDDEDDGPMLMSEANFFKPGYELMHFGEPSFFLPSDSFAPHVNLFDTELKRTWKAMLDIVMDTWIANKDFSEEIAEILIKRNNLPDPTPIDNLSVVNSVYVGQITVDLSKIESPELLVDGLGKYSSHQIVLDISSLKEYSVFPGQVIAFKGVSRGTETVIATKIYSSARGPVPPPPIIPEKFSIMIAAGPFLTLAKPKYDLFEKIIQHTNDIQPSLLILVGPFLDCDPHSYGSHYYDFQGSEKFSTMYHQVLTKFSQAFARMKTKVYYVVSSRDPPSMPVFPTPIHNKLTDEYSHNVIPDPSLLNIHGLIFGITTSDILSYMTKQEYTSYKPENQIERVTRHLIDQQSFYPLYTEPLYAHTVDFSKLFYYSRIPVVPHVLVLPSSLECFIKDIDGCIIVNPEKCSPDLNGNNFAVIEVRPPKDDEKWCTSTHISTKILRI